MTFKVIKVKILNSIIIIHWTGIQIKSFTLVNGSLRVLKKTYNLSKVWQFCLDGLREIANMADGQKSGNDGRRPKEKSQEAGSQNGASEDIHNATNNTENLKKKVYLRAHLHMAKNLSTKSRRSVNE